jgi:hypothetical protein
MTTRAITTTLNCDRRLLNRMGYLSFFFSFRHFWCGASSDNHTNPRELFKRLRTLSLRSSNTSRHPSTSRAGLHSPRHMHQGAMHSKKGGKGDNESEIRGSQRDLRTKTSKRIVDRRSPSEHRVEDSRDEMRREKETRAVKRR